MKLGVALHFCTDDAAFLPAILCECRTFTDTVVIAYYDHFFDGQPEDPTLMSDLALRFPWAQWMCIPFPGVAKSRDAMHRLHGQNRWHAVNAMPADVTHALLLDSDEVPDGEMFAAFKPTKPAYRFQEYLYWQEPTRCCRSGTGTAVLLERSLWTPPVLVSGRDRGAAPAATVTEPMIHHFSWARSLEQIERKIARWPNQEPEFLAAIRAAWAQPFGGRDCLRRSETREYFEVANRFDLPCSTI